VRQKKISKFFDEIESNDELLKGVKKLKCEVFYVIIGRLVMNLR